MSSGITSTSWVICTRKATILIFCCYRNKLPQIKWHKTTQIYSFKVLEVRSLKSRHWCWQGCIPSGSFRVEFISLSFPAFRKYFHFLPHGPFFHFQRISLQTPVLLLYLLFLSFTFLPPFYEFVITTLGPPGLSTLKFLI